MGSSHPPPLGEPQDARRSSDQTGRDRGRDRGQRLRASSASPLVVLLLRALLIPVGLTATLTHVLRGVSLFSITGRLEVMWEVVLGLDNKQYPSFSHFRASLLIQKSQVTNLRGATQSLSRLLLP